MSVSVDVGFMMGCRVWKSQNLFELVDRTQQMPVMVQLRGAMAPLELDFYVDGEFRCTAVVQPGQPNMHLTCAPGWLPEFSRLTNKEELKPIIFFEEGQPERVLEIAPHGGEVMLKMRIRYAKNSEPYVNYMRPARMD